MANEETAAYRVKGTSIRYAGKIVRAGRTINLPAEEAERLRDFLDPIEAGEDTVVVSTEEFEAVRSTLQGKIDALTEELTTSSSAADALKTTVDSLNSQLASRESDLDELTVELTAARDRIAALESDLATANGSLTAAQSEVAELKKTTAKGGKK